MSIVNFSPKIRYSRIAKNRHLCYRLPLKQNLNTPNDRNPNSLIFEERHKQLITTQDEETHMVSAVYFMSVLDSGFVEYKKHLFDEATHFNIGTISIIKHKLQCAKENFKIWSKVLQEIINNTDICECKKKQIGWDEHYIPYMLQVEVIHLRVLFHP